MNQSIYTLSPQSKKLPLNIFGIGFEENQVHIVRKEGFPVHQFFLCTAGEGRIVIQNAEFTVKSGDFYYIPANIPHEYFALKEKWKVQWVAFYADSSLLDNTGFKDFEIFNLQNKQAYDSVFKKIFNTLKNETESSKLAASANLYELLSLVYSEKNKEADSSLSESRALQTALDFINEHYAEYFTIDDLSHKAGVSPQYLCRLFQKYYKMRPFQYVALKRIQKAKELLQKPSLPVSEIARQTGYDDFSYFCSVFKKLEGISPTQFRGMC